jgi:hypothetical protein
MMAQARTPGLRRSRSHLKILCEILHTPLCPTPENQKLPHNAHSLGCRSGRKSFRCALSAYSAAKQAQPTATAAFGRFNMTSYLHRLRGGLVTCQRFRPRLSFFFFREEVLSRRPSGTNEAERANILAPGFRPRKPSGHTFFPPSPPSRSCGTNDWLIGSRIQLQQRNCSRFTRDFSRRSTDQNRKELPQK